MIELNAIQLIFICFVAGEVFKILFPYLVKWRESGYSLKFNPAFLMDLVVILIGAIVVGIFDFSLWVIPAGELWLVCLIAFSSAAGLDEILQRFLKIVDAYKKIGLKIRPLSVN